MTGLQFANPHWAYLIWPVVLVTVVLIWLDGRGVDRLDQFLSKAMQQRLVRRPARWRRFSRIGLLGLSAVCLIVALMRPQWGFRYEHTPRVGAQIMICLDVSRSMLAADAAPNRLERAKADIQDMLTLLDRDHVGLIAFAGTATVLCPMTPDYGFLRMILETVNPQSVARGGTNLEAPIRKATAGFRGPSDLSRTILLITDGEDHESFAMDAATAAAERGIRIIAIGFGDETGSEVFLIDPKTGARTQLLDGDGKPVITRLDGQLLRKMALKTQGAYIPAGTGTLDLRSIYDAHIAPLTRGRLDDRGRLVKQEGFQWMVLLALLSLIAASVVTSASSGQRVTHIKPTQVAAVVWALLVAPLGAQTMIDQDTPEPQDTLGDQMSDDDAQLDPRQAYNQAVALLDAGKFDDAEHRFKLARRHAAADGQTRYSATYNLSWVEVGRADTQLDEEPAQALVHLQTAVAYLREAIRLQPDEVTPRQNLEIIARRALALADAIASRDRPALETRIDQVIDQQRQLAAVLQQMIDRTAGAEGPAVLESVRARCRSAEIQQRGILSTVEQLTQEAGQEADQIEAIQVDQQTVDQRLRLAQLAGVRSYLQRAAQRIGQARRQLRQVQADRAYRRASLALNELKRARDQLRAIAQLLGAVIGDATTLAQHTSGLAAAADQTLVATDQAPRPPPWLTQEIVKDELAMVAQRTDELRRRVEAGIRGGDQQEEEHDRDTTDQLTRLTQAAPLVKEATQAMDHASKACVAGDLWESYRLQVQATGALVRARELFLDVRGLVDLIYTDQRRLQVAASQLAAPGAKQSELLPALAQLQSTNTQRGVRLGDLMDQELQRSKPGPASDTDPSDPGQEEGRAEQFQLASDLLSQLMETFEHVTATIESLGHSAPDAHDVESLKTKIQQSVEQAEALRRLFLTVVEHLRDTAQKQVQLTDDTRDAAVLAKRGGQTNQTAGPLVERQRRLGDISQQIADALINQSKQSSVQSSPSEDPAAASGQASQDLAYRLTQAADRVNQATQAMAEAITGLEHVTTDFQLAQDQQSTAVENLVAALEFLAPQQDQDQDQQKEQSQQGAQQPQQGDEGDQNQDNADQPSGEQHMNAARLLQAVRDRQAQRQRQRAEKQTAGYGAVEKDW